MLEALEPRKVFVGSALEDLGEQVVFPLEMIIDHRFGGLEPIAGEKPCFRIKI